MKMDINSTHLRFNSYNYSSNQYALMPGVPIWWRLSTVGYTKQIHRATRSGFLCSACSALYKQLKAERTTFNTVQNNWVDTELPAVLMDCIKTPFVRH